MCSKKWAKPVSPCRSFFDPTWYVRQTVVRGAAGSWLRATFRPFASRYDSTGSCGVGESAARKTATLLLPTQTKHNTKINRVRWFHMFVLDSVQAIVVGLGLQLVPSSATTAR